MGVNSIQDRIKDGILQVETDELKEVMETLKTELGFNYLSNLTAVDYQDYFEVVYHLVALNDYTNLEVKVEITDYENPSISSVVDIWRTANWQEREVYDMFGINFNNHPDLRRLLLSEDFEGHPLRKSYQLDTE